VNLNINNSLFLCAFHHALVQWRTADFRKQRDDVDPHSMKTSNIHRSTSNTETVRAFDSFAPAHSAFSLPVYVARRPPAPFW
jgi:hypothetical protein